MNLKAVNLKEETMSKYVKAINEICSTKVVKMKSEGLMISGPGKSVEMMKFTWPRGSILVLLNQECPKIHLKIEIKSNRLVIGCFTVEGISALSLAYSTRPLLPQKLLLFQRHLFTTVRVSKIESNCSSKRLKRNSGES